MSVHHATALSAQLTLTDLFHKQVRLRADAPAVSQGARTLTYAALHARVSAWANLLQAHGLQHGDRIAIWSENRIEYIELQLAAAQLGLVIACLNWRLQGEEQAHCIRLVEPRLIVVSGRYRDVLATLADRGDQVLDLDSPDVDEVQRLADGQSGSMLYPALMPPVPQEDAFLILYTSGTTGLPKGAVISQRASVARTMVFAAEYGLNHEDGFIAWSPLFHMAATDHSLATLLLGGHVVVQDGFDPAAIASTLQHERIGWLMAMPGTIEPMIDALKAARQPVRGVRMVGAMADLVPRHQIAELTALLGAPYLNTFGSTETGLPPASGSLLTPGQVPTSLAKRESGWCQVRLVDSEGEDVPVEAPGDMLVRGPTLFSGYWSRGRVDPAELADGWYHMGDMFVRHADGMLDFVDRSKYLIKTGGENVYPAEIERVLLAHDGVEEAVVVRRPDDRWGEVPVAFVAVTDGALGVDALTAYCRERLSGYKVPKEIRLVSASVLPRNSTGKIQKKLVEAML